MTISLAVIPWLPLVAVTLHLFEEFVWPGGFGNWYRSYRPERAASVTTTFLFLINALFVAMAVVPGVLGFRPYGVAIWLVVASIAAANGIFHLWASFRSRVYSPGVVTGCLVYEAALIGPAFHIYSAWNHRRRAWAQLERASK